MTIAKQDVGPPIVVHIEKSAAPSQILGVRPKACRKRGILKISASEIVVERGRIPREISFDDVEIAIQIVIRR